MCLEAVVQQGLMEIGFGRELKPSALLFSLLAVLLGVPGGLKLPRCVSFSRF